MKFITLLFFFIAVNSYAGTKCSPEMIALQYNEHGYVELKTTNFETGLSKLEEKMIHKAVTQQDYLSTNTPEQSLEDFGGSADGEIVYYKVGHKVIAKVHYWPGDNEFGAYVEVVGSKVIIHAHIGDSEIVCH
jgi:hypothetical protein